MQCCQLQKKGAGQQEDKIRPKTQNLGQHFRIGGEATQQLKLGGEAPQKKFGPNSKYLGLIFNILPAK